MCEQVSKVSQNKDLDGVQRREDIEKHSYLAFSRMNAFRKRGQLCDVIVKVGAKEFPAHRVVLAASSDYFDAMFSSGMAESAQFEVELKSISPDVMEALLDFVYTGQVKVSMDNVQDLLPAASLVQMEGVKAACSTFLYGEIDSANVLGIRRFAELHNCSDLEIFAKNYAAHNFQTVIDSEEFLFLAPEELLELIGREDLHIDNEETVYRAVIRWVYNDVNERASKLAALLRRIRLSVMSVRFLTDDVLIRNSLECRDLVDDAKRFYLRPDLRHEMRDARYHQRDGGEEYLVVIGGFGAGQSPSDSVEMFNPRTCDWNTLPNLPISYRYVAACSLGTCVYVIGGFDGSERLNTVGVLDIAQRDDGWRWLASMHYKRGLSAACTHRGLIYVCGGFDGQTRLRSLEVYHPKIDEWRILDEMVTAREGAGLVVADDNLYCLGGYDGFHLLNSMELFDLRTGSWSPCKPMYMRRSGAGCAVLIDTIYVCGGYGGAEGRGPLHLDTVEAYNTRLAQWTLVTSMNMPRCYVGACPLAGRIYVAAGYNGSRLLDTVEFYDPIDNSWTMYEDSRMHHERCDTGMCVVRFLACTEPTSCSSNAHLSTGSGLFRRPIPVLGDSNRDFNTFGSLAPASHGKVALSTTVASALNAVSPSFLLHQNACDAVVTSTAPPASVTTCVPVSASIITSAGNSVTSHRVALHLGSTAWNSDFVQDSSGPSIPATTLAYESTASTGIGGIECGISPDSSSTFCLPIRPLRDLDATSITLVERALTSHSSASPYTLRPSDIFHIGLSTAISSSPLVGSSSVRPAISTCGAYYGPVAPPCSTGSAVEPNGCQDSSFDQTTNEAVGRSTRASSGLLDTTYATDRIFSLGYGLKEEQFNDRGVGQVALLEVQQHSGSPTLTHSELPQANTAHTSSDSPHISAHLLEADIDMEAVEAGTELGVERRGFRLFGRTAPMDFFCRSGQMALASVGPLVTNESGLKRMELVSSSEAACCSNVWRVSSATCLSRKKTGAQLSCGSSLLSDGPYDKNSPTLYSLGDEQTTFLGETQHRLAHSPEDGLDRQYDPDFGLIDSEVGGPMLEVDSEHAAIDARLVGATLLEEASRSNNEGINNDATKDESGLTQTTLYKVLGGPLPSRALNRCAAQGSVLELADMNLANPNNSTRPFLSILTPSAKIATCSLSEPIALIEPSSYNNFAETQEPITPNLVGDQEKAEHRGAKSLGEKGEIKLDIIRSKRENRTHRLAPTGLGNDPVRLTPRSIEDSFPVFSSDQADMTQPSRIICDLVQPPSSLPNRLFQHHLIPPDPIVQSPALSSATTIINPFAVLDNRPRFLAREFVPNSERISTICELSTHNQHKSPLHLIADDSSQLATGSLSSTSDSCHTDTKTVVVCKASAATNRQEFSHSHSTLSTLCKQQRPQLPPHQSRLISSGVGQDEDDASYENPMQAEAEDDRDEEAGVRQEIEADTGIAMALLTLTNRQDKLNIHPLISPLPALNLSNSNCSTTGVDRSRCFSIRRSSLTDQSSHNLDQCTGFLPHDFFSDQPKDLDIPLHSMGESCVTGPPSANAVSSFGADRPCYARPGPSGSLIAPYHLQMLTSQSDSSSTQDSQILTLNSGDPSTQSSGFQGQYDRLRVKRQAAHTPPYLVTPTAFVSATSSCIMPKGGNIAENGNNVSNNACSSNFILGSDRLFDSVDSSNIVSFPGAGQFSRSVMITTTPAVSEVPVTSFAMVTSAMSISSPAASIYSVRDDSNLVHLHQQPSPSTPLSSSRLASLDKEVARKLATDCSSSSSVASTLPSSASPSISVIHAASGSSSLLSSLPVGHVGAPTLQTLGGPNFMAIGHDAVMALHKSHISHRKHLHLNCQTDHLSATPLPSPPQSQLQQPLHLQGFRDHDSLLIGANQVGFNYSI